MELGASTASNHPMDRFASEFHKSQNPKHDGDGLPSGTHRTSSARYFSAVGRVLLLVAAIVALSGCSSGPIIHFGGTNFCIAPKPDPKIHEYEWVLERIIDAKGNTWKYGPHGNASPGNDFADLRIEFSESNTFQMTDQDTNEQTGGTYELRPISRVFQLVLTFENGSSAMGVYGLNVSEDCSTTPVVSFQHSNRTYLFIGSN